MILGFWTLEWIICYALKLLISISTEEDNCNTRIIWNVGSSLNKLEGNRFKFRVRKLINVWSFFNFLFFLFFCFSILMYTILEVWSRSSPLCVHASVRTALCVLVPYLRSEIRRSGVSLSLVLSGSERYASLIPIRVLINLSSTPLPYNTMPWLGGEPLAYHVVNADI